MTASLFVLACTVALTTVLLAQNLDSLSDDSRKCFANCYHRSFGALPPNDEALIGVCIKYRKMETCLPQCPEPEMLLTACNMTEECGGKLQELLAGQDLPDFSADENKTKLWQDICAKFQTLFDCFDSLKIVFGDQLKPILDLAARLQATASFEQDASEECHLLLSKLATVEPIKSDNNDTNSAESMEPDVEESQTTVTEPAPQQVDDKPKPEENEVEKSKTTEHQQGGIEIVTEQPIIGTSSEENNTISEVREEPNGGAMSNRDWSLSLYALCIILMLQCQRNR